MEGKNFTELSKGEIARLFVASENAETVLNPLVLQILDVCDHKASSGTSLQMVLSDSVHSCRALLKLPWKSSAKLLQFDVICIQDYTLAFIRGIVILLKKAPVVLYTGLQERIGKPMDYALMNLRQAAKKAVTAKADIPTVAVKLSQLTFSDKKISFTSIKDLNEKDENAVIKVRIIKKSDVYLKNNGIATLKLILLDENNQDIFAFANGQEAYEFNSYIEEQQMATISNFKVKSKSQEKDSLILIFDSKTIIEIIQDDYSIKTSKFNLVSFDQLEFYINKVVDVEGRVKFASHPAQYSVKEGSIERQELIISDNEGREIKITLWRGIGSDIDFSKKPKLIFHKVTVRQYGKVVLLSTHDYSEIIIEPEDPDFRKLPETLSRSVKFMGKKECIRMVAEIEKENEKETFLLQGVIINFLSVSYYLGCPKCLKKCNKTEDKCKFCLCYFVAPERLRFMSFLLSDGTQNLTVVSFDNTAKNILGKSLKNIVEESTLWLEHSLIKEALYKRFVFKIRKSVSKQGIVRNTVTDIIHANYKIQNSSLLCRLERFQDFIT